MIRLNIIILGALLFFSISIGGGIAYVLAKVFQNSNELLALICGGFLIGILSLDIIPGASEMYELPGIILGVLIGYILFSLMHQFLHSTKRATPSVYLLIIGLFIHTIPISLTIGNVLGESSFATTISTATILHHLPEGFAIASAFLVERKKLGRLFLIFFGLAICFSFFIWVGHHIELSTKVEGLLVGISISLIGFTSIKEFILHNISVISLKGIMFFVLMGYLLSMLFHLFT